MMQLRDHYHAMGFTLIEILLAAAAGAMVLVVVFGIFSNAMKMRDTATAQTHDARERMRATKVIRDDLRNAIISGGLMASVVEGDSTQSQPGVNSTYPGYLKLMTTNGRDDDNNLWGDVQQVEYYIVRDPDNTTGANAGNLVRAVTRDLLDSPSPAPSEQPILERVESFQVAFYDGTNWQTSWDYDASASGSNSTTGGSTGSSSSSTSGSSSSNSSNGQTETLPLAIRIDIQQAPESQKAPTPAPIEVLMPWTTQPFTSATPEPSASASP